MKIVLIVKTALIIDEHNKDKTEDTYESDLNLFYKIIKTCLVPVLLILLQPDTGICIIIFISIAIMTLCSGVRKEWFTIGMILIRDAMRFRGIGISVRSVLTKPMMTLEYTMVPLLMSTATISDELAAASLSRGLDADTKRTCIEDIRLRTQDFLLILFSFVIAATGGMV